MRRSQVTMLTPTGLKQASRFPSLLRCSPVDLSFPVCHVWFCSSVAVSCTNSEGWSEVERGRELECSQRGVSCCPHLRKHIFGPASQKATV